MAGRRECGAQAQGTPRTAGSQVREYEAEARSPTIQSSLRQNVAAKFGGPGSE